LRKAKDTKAAGSTTTTLDDIDRQVVAALQAEGRRAFVSMAEEFGISESVVRYRVQRLEKAGILQVVGIADPLKIGSISWR
jgi:Lrp/AsnC family transcriptional regulator, regulator for asnA, asnC and gidA